LVRAIAAANVGAVRRLLIAHPQLARHKAAVGATRQSAGEYFLEAIECYLYAGDTALHIAAAAYDEGAAARLVAGGADVRAKNRHGQEPLHYAVVGAPGSQRWNPKAQTAMIRLLLEAGADPNCVDRSGATPLHRAVRTRCSAAVRALIKGGADPKRTNGSGSTPLMLAKLTTGRGGSGTPEAKAEQQKILDTLRAFGAD
jgi:Ankyrin repeats (many copies)/Ankyrin repeat